MKLKFIIDQKYDLEMISAIGMGESDRLFCQEIYKDNYELLEYSQREYQKSWNKINNIFSEYIKKETGHDWFYQNYYCVVSAIHPGISNWGNKPIIARWWQENAYAQRRITAHELIISHYFEIYKRYYHNNFKLKDEQVWALAEIAAFALTSITNEIKDFWPWDRGGYYYDHNYPQIAPLQKRLKTSFIKRKSFDEYMRRGFKLVEKMPEITP